MSQYNAQKNPPWARPNEFANVQQQQSLPQQMMNPNVMQYPQQAVTNPQQASVYQAQLAMQQQALSMQQFVANNAQQIYNPTVSGLAQANVTRNSVGIVPANTVMMQQTAVMPQQQQQQQQSSNNAGTPSKQRVFTGTVTKVVDTYGFVDEDVFFQMSCVKGPHPVLHDRVLVEAVCLPSMPFKWNATRVQVLPMNEGGNNRKRASNRDERMSNSYSAVPPPNDIESRRDRERDRDRDRGSRGRSPDAEERRRRRERREREDKDRDKESRAHTRSRTRSPRRTSSAATNARKYRVRIPEFSLDVGHFSVTLLKSRYPSLYIPSDFFAASARWTENFPQHRPLQLAGPSRFHVLEKDVEPIFVRDDVVEPPDADFLFSAKVMLLSIPNKEELMKRCVQLAEEKERSRGSHPARLIDCLVGVNSRAKSEYMAIGGPWSPSLDGEDPVADPSVLIKTAIRTCRALTNIDLAPVTKWYRFAELHYHRAKTTYKSKEIPARVETVVIYAPDVWSVMPSALEWDGLHLNYQRALERKLADLVEPEPDAAAVDDEKEADASVEVKEPTHWSKLDLKLIKVNELRDELAARNMSPKGLRLQLIARLSKQLKQEQEAEEEKAKVPTDSDAASEDRKKTDEEKKNREKEEREKEKGSKDKAKEKNALLEKYKLPEKPHIVVHPCKKAKSGKFNCKVVCLSLLLDYSQEINKEHTFEVSLFAENFNEMLMRDFGLQIYKALSLVPEKTEEKKEEKSKEKEKERKSEEKKEEEKRPETDDGEESKDASEKNAVNGKEDDDEEKRKRKRNGKKKERPSLRTINPDLLLAFSYFDTTNYGKMTGTDVEELLQMLGLQLSRSQIKKLVSRLTTDSYLDYRKLTDTPVKAEDADVMETDEKSLAEAVLTEISDASVDLGNVPLIPNFNLYPKQDDGTDSPPAKRVKQEPGLVYVGGSLVNVENLQQQLEKNEEARLKAEEKAMALRHDLNNTKEKLEQLQKQLKDACKECSIAQRKFETSNDRLAKELISSDIYLTTLMDIQERIAPILDTDEIKRLVKTRQDLLGAPQINLVPLTKIEDIVFEDDVEMDDIKIKDEKNAIPS